jgi:hypothetical protein
MPDRPADSNAVEAEAYLSSSPSGDTDISEPPSAAVKAIPRFLSFPNGMSLECAQGESD